MAQQQDPNAPQGNDVARAASGGGAIAAGSSDSYRAPGFESKPLSTTGNSLSGITAAPGGSAPVAPTTTVWGKYSGALTPGIQAAMGSSGSGQPGIPGKGATLESVARDPIGGLFGGGLVDSIFGFGNNSQLQDIGGALYQGLPITDADWANAGYGPGGATLATTAAPTTGVRSITTNPMIGAGLLPATLAAAKAQQPAGTIPTNAVMKY